jgi:hypothetical protein
MHFSNMQVQMHTGTFPHVFSLVLDLEGQGGLGRGAKNIYFHFQFLVQCASRVKG